ncbi:MULTISPECIES: hypothetical protein [unclassified Modestobacter]
MPYPHRDRATAALRAQLRHDLAPGDQPDWGTFTVAGPVETADLRGRIWFEYRAELTTAG